jgi:hypothetical protein
MMIIIIIITDLKAERQRNLQIQQIKKEELRIQRKKEEKERWSVFQYLNHLLFYVLKLTNNPPAQDVLFPRTDHGIYYTCDAEGFSLLLSFILRFFVSFSHLLFFTYLSLILMSDEFHF